MPAVPEPLDPDTLVGLSAEDAGRRAESAGWTVRPLPPGAMMTMDFRPDRLNLHLDDAGLVVRAHAG